MEHRAASGIATLRRTAITASWNTQRSVIIGAKRLDQPQGNLAAVELTLTQDELRQLDEVSALAPEYPGWVLPFQGADRLDPAVSRFKQ